MGSTICSKWDLDSLMKTWNSMYDHKYYKIHNEDKDIQGLFLLLEGVYDRVQQFATRVCNTSVSYKKALIELEEKQNENEALKKKVLKLNECEKCKLLEKKLAETTKKANEAHNRMNSIAKILCLGTVEGDNDKRNTALSLVSQMLLTESSPKRKRRCTQAKNSPTKENVILPASMDTLSENVGKDEQELGAVGGVAIPETTVHSPLKHITNTLDKTPPPQKTGPNRRLSLTVNIPLENGRPVVSVKRNLSLDCASQESECDVIAGSPSRNKKKTLSFNINLDNIKPMSVDRDSTTVCGDNNDTTLDETLLEYVKEGRSELEKIWFDDELKPAEVAQKQDTTPIYKEIAETTTYLNQIIEETPSRDCNFLKTLEKRKQADFWLLKEKRELCQKTKTLDGKKLRQTKLELGIKPKAVDISKLTGFNGGVHQIAQETQDKDEDIIPGSPNSQTFDEVQVLTTANEINTEHIADFKPLASSTQRSIVDGNVASTTDVTSKSKEFVYKRDAVKKKCERAKLPGWDCDECRKYYGAMSLSPSKVKERMNACSRHRDKFKPKLNDTPPGFWNPLFPDTQECKEKGMYVSIYGPSSSNH